MRLDQFLTASRIIKRRTLAQEFCENGRVSVNGTVAKSSKEIKIGDAVIVRRNTEHVTLRVLKLPATKQVSKAEAESLFEVVAIDPVDEPI
ncbi:MAG: RNA-binding S4 domain-containing protein [Acidobacteriota bacterium]